jgi:hypothetical protein
MHGRKIRFTPCLVGLPVNKLMEKREKKGPVLLIRYRTYMVTGIQVDSAIQFHIVVSCFGGSSWFALQRTPPDL